MVTLSQSSKSSLMQPVTRTGTSSSGNTMFFQCFIVSVIKVVSRQGRTILRFCFESFKRSRTNVREESPGCEMGTNSSQSWREKGRSQSGYEKMKLFIVQPILQRVFLHPTLLLLLLHLNRTYHYLLLYPRYCHHTDLLI